MRALARGYVGGHCRSQGAEAVAEGPPAEAVAVSSATDSAMVTAVGSAEAVEWLAVVALAATQMEGQRTLVQWAGRKTGWRLGPVRARHWSSATVRTCLSSKRAQRGPGEVEVERVAAPREQREEMFTISEGERSTCGMWACTTYLPPGGEL